MGLWSQSSVVGPNQDLGCFTNLLSSPNTIIVAAFPCIFHSLERSAPLPAPPPPFVVRWRPASTSPQSNYPFVTLSSSPPPPCNIQHNSWQGFSLIRSDKLKWFIVLCGCNPLTLSTTTATMVSVAVGNNEAIAIVCHDFYCYPPTMRRRHILYWMANVSLCTPTLFVVSIN